jgi:tripartite-type tricarboxylate transporter receptor subunit TctC
MFIQKSVRLLNKLGASLGLALVFGGGCQAAEWVPERQLRIISAYSAGGTNDLLSRLMAQKLTDRLGKPVVVENRAGANGIIASDYVAKSPPDGYTMVMGSSATHGINPNIYAKLSYDAERDFTPVGLIATVPLLLVVAPNLAVNTLSELIALAKAKPGTLSFASSGTGSSPHLAGELFKSVANIELTHVPYKGDGPAVIDVQGGQVSMFFANIPSALPAAQAGRLKALAMTGAARTPAAPEVPTMQQAGVAGVEISAWFGLFAPAKLPTEVLARLNQELNAVLSLPEVQTRIRELGAEPVAPANPEKFQSFVKSELAKFAAVTKNAGITAQ